MVFVKARMGLRIYKLWSRFHDLITRWRQNVPTTDSESLVIKVKSSWTSKVNWAAAGGIFISLLDLLVRAMSAEDQDTLMNSIQTAASWEDVVKVRMFVGIIVMRTFFTTSLTKASTKGIRVNGTEGPEK